MNSVLLAEAPIEVFLLIMAAAASCGFLLGWAFRVLRFERPVTQLRSCVTHGHRYEPRYDVVPPAELTFDGKGMTKESLLDLTRAYIRDVCAHCGATNERLPK